MTKQLLPWTVAAIVITLVGVQACRVSQRAQPASTDAKRDGVQADFERPREVAPLEAQALAYTPPTETHTATVPPSRRKWCEPLALPYCPTDDHVCAAMPDGTPAKCQRQWLSPHDSAKYCVPQVPGKQIKKWRRARLRMIVDSVCTRRRGCEPEELTDYLQALATRETSMRPWKRHRLSVDIEAAETSWGRRSEVFADSPAHDEPWRWTTGLGYFGQNPALWLDVWDASAEPETLCGEVEAVLVHLRAARKRWHRIADGYVDCGSADGWGFTGPRSEGLPSWYDLSLVNSGSSACPATQGRALDQRRSFERRAERLGLEAYAGVGLEGLGETVAVEVQEEFAAELRARLDAEHPTL